MPVIPVMYESLMSGLGLQRALVATAGTSPPLHPETHLTVTSHAEEMPSSWREGAAAEAHAGFWFTVKHNTQRKPSGATGPGGAPPPPLAKLVVCERTEEWQRVFEPKNK